MLKSRYFLSESELFRPMHEKSFILLEILLCSGEVVKLSRTEDFIEKCHSALAPAQYFWNVLNFKGIRYDTFEN